MGNHNSPVAEGTSVLGLLGVAFVTLKLCGVVDWSWWWVTMPFWWWPAVVLSVILILGVCICVVVLLERLTAKN